MVVESEGVFVEAVVAARGCGDEDGDGVMPGVIRFSWSLCS